MLPSKAKQTKEKSEWNAMGTCLHQSHLRAVIEKPFLGAELSEGEGEDIVTNQKGKLKLKKQLVWGFVLSCFLAARGPKSKGMWSQGWFSENPNPEDSAHTQQNRVPGPKPEQRASPKQTPHRGRELFVCMRKNLPL